MSDISKCENSKCTLKEKCYRYKSPPSSYQTYADFSQDENGDCDYYWEHKEDSL